MKEEELKERKKVERPTRKNKKTEYQKTKERNLTIIITSMLITCVEAIFS